MIEGLAPPLEHIANHIPGGSDPLVDSMADGQILVWDAGAGAFKAATVSAGGGLGSYNDTDLYFQSCFASIDGWEELTADDGSVTLDGYNVFIRSSTTSGGYARIMKYLKYPTVPLSWNKVRKFKVRAELRSVTNDDGIIEIISGLTGNHMHFGFRVDDGELFGVSYLGAESVTGVLEVLGTGTYTYCKTLEAVFTPGSKVEFYIDGVKEGELTTQLPTGADSDYVALNLNVSNEGSAKDIWIKTSEIKFYQAA